MFKYPYQNPQLTIRQRVEDLFSRMSIKEKVGQVNQHLYGWKCYSKKNSGIELTEDFKKHVEWGGGIGALYGLFRADPWSRVDFSNGIPANESWKVANQVQQYVIRHSRWGIPALIVEECPHGHQGLEGVSYPTNIGRGNTFNPELTTRACQLMAKELASKGIHLALVSALDLVKDPRWGRSEECFGEDPILSAGMTEAIIKGFQGDLINQYTNFLDQTVAEIKKEPGQIGVVLKHCIAQGEALGGHNSGTVTIGRREFVDVYGPLLKSTRNAVGVMAAYNDVDGIPCHINGTLFNEMLRDNNHFQGIVMADGLALDRLGDVFDSKLIAASAALTAGIDLSLWDDTFTQIEDGINKHIIPEESLDRAVRRVLSVKFLLGLFDNPYVDDPSGQWDKILTESEALNLTMAEESITLLKNDGLLPLQKKYKKIAVVGPNANDFYNLLGDYTAPQKEDLLDKTIYMELKDTFSGSEVEFAQGCEVRNLSGQDQLMEKALHVARDADVIIAVLGGSSARDFDAKFFGNGAVSSKAINMDSGENVDVASLSLGGKQVELLRKLGKLGKPLITVLVQGRPYDITEVEQIANAVLIAWFPGQRGAEAIAHTLTGDNNPSGKLSISYPRNSQQLPVYYYQRDAAKQDDYYDGSGCPLHHFGEGRSYTKFVYTDLRVKQAGDNVNVSVQVKNIGKFAGKESTLLFVKLFGDSVIQRTKMLRAFCKSYLIPGEQKKLAFTLFPEDFCYMDINYHNRCAEKAVILVDVLKKEIACH